jgi:hypothetical protein
MKEQDFITLPKSVAVKGQRWHLYGAEFTGADGAFGLHFYAISPEHAAMVVEDIKATLTLTGKFEGAVQL